MKQKIKIHEVMLEQEMSITGLTADEVYANMDKNLQTMENAWMKDLRA